MRNRVMGIVLVFVLSTCRTCEARQPHAVPSSPNILLILTDDLRWRDLSCYGSTFYETPNIDRLASQGMRFTDAYAAHS